VVRWRGLRLGGVARLAGSNGGVAASSGKGKARARARERLVPFYRRRSPHLEATRGRGGTRLVCRGVGGVAGGRCGQGLARLTRDMPRTWGREIPRPVGSVIVRSRGAAWSGPRRRWTVGRHASRGRGIAVPDFV
jgi:hypothetical protein